jgi:hypothetical protein
MNTTQETDALIAADLHHLEDDETCPASAYWRMADLCREMERQRGEITERLREEQRLHIRTLNERDELRHQIRETLMENLHLADGEDCTLRRLKDAIGFDLQDENQTTPMP